MRRMFLVLGCICVLAAPAWAGGAFDVFGAYSETAETNASLGLGARISAGGQNLVFDLTATWLRQSSTTVPTDEGAVSSDEVTLTPVDAGIRYLFARGTEFRPYLGAGASYFLVNARIAEVDDELGYYVNAGFLWGAPRGMRFFGEAVYRVADITADYGPLGRVDLDVGGLGVVAGLSFSF